MKKQATKTLLLYYLITLLLFGIDRILKYAALSQEAVDSNSIRGFFCLEKNSGIAFGLQAPKIFLYILIVSALILLVSFSLEYFRQKNFFPHFLTLVIIAGAASNLIDRLKYGYVIDYFALKFWPVFNLADMMIVVGVIFWILNLKDRKIINNL